MDAALKNLGEQKEAMEKEMAELLKEIKNMEEAGFALY